MCDRCSILCFYALNSQKTHGKSYTGEEDEKRMKLYFENKERVKQHNEAYEKGEVTFSMGINQFSDQVNYNFSLMVKIINSSLIGLIFCQQLPEEVCCGRGVAKKD